MAAAAVVAVWDGALFCCVLAAVALHEGAHFAALGLCGAGVRSVRAGLTGVLVEKRDTRLGIQLVYSNQRGMTNSINNVGVHAHSSFRFSSEHCISITFTMSVRKSLS
jgi:hypothetical protein